MRKIVLFALFCVILCSSLCGQSYKKDTVNNTVVYSVEKNSNSDIALTEFKYRDNNGLLYPVYVNKATGRCFVNKISSKTNKEYKYYLSRDICIDICDKLGIEYKENTHIVGG